jgi:hypothetical protein
VYNPLAAFAFVLDCRVGAHVLQDYNRRIPGQGCKLPTSQVLEDYMLRQLMGAVLALAVLLAVAEPAGATIYKYIDKNGNMVLTDQPVPGAVEVPEHPVMTMSFPKGDVQPMATSKKEEKPNYVITITSPAPNAIFYRQQDHVVAVAVSVDPALKPGSALVLQLDGKPFDGSEIDIDAMERGSHNVGAKIVDLKGNVVAEGPSNIFYVQQHTTNQGGGK